MVLKNLCVLVLWTRVASALERLLLEDSEGDTASSACDTSTIQIYYAILQLLLLQFRHLIPAPADGASTNTWSYKHRWIAMGIVAWESTLLSVVGCQETGWQSGVRSCILKGLRTI